MRELHSVIHGLLQWAPGFPTNFEGPVLPGSMARHHSGFMGSLVLQELVSDLFRLQLLVVYPIERVTLAASSDPGFQSLLILQGDVRLELDLTEVKLYQDQYLLWQEKEKKWNIELEPGSQLSLLLTDYSAQLAKEIAGAFPSLGAFLAGASEGIKGPYATGPGIRDAVHRILHADHASEKLPYYLKTQVNDFLFQLLDKAVKAASFSPSLSTWERDALYKVRDLILADILTHHPISELARIFRMNPFRLKVVFKKEFGVGPYEYLLNARLEKAKRLMEEGLPMKQAAPLAGYRITSFITAFKRRFGYSPGRISKGKNR